MTEPVATPHKNVKHDRTYLEHYASANFERGLHLIHESKFAMACKKFQSAQKARILLHDDIHHISIAPGYEILGHVELALEEFDKAKFHFLAAQEIVEKNLNLLVGGAEEYRETNDLLTISSQRIKNGLKLLENRKGHACSDFVKHLDATIIDSISDDLIKYSNLSGTFLTNYNAAIKQYHEAGEKQIRTADSHAQDSTADHKSLPSHDASSANDDTGGDESTMTKLVDVLHDSASNNAPTWLVQDENPHVPPSNLDESHTVKIMPRVHALMEELDATFSLGSLHNANISQDANGIIYQDPLTADQEFCMDQLIRGQDEKPGYATNSYDEYSEDKTNVHLNFNEAMNDSPRSSQVINATTHRPSSLIVDEDDEIFIPEAIAIDRDTDIPQASVVVPEKNALSLTVNGRKVPAFSIVAIVFIVLALLIGFLVDFALKKSSTSMTVRQNVTTTTDVEKSIESHVIQRNATFRSMNDTDPRFLALDWILNKDEMQLKVTNPNLYQRYILALIAFHFSSLEWTYCGNYMNTAACYVSKSNNSEVGDESFVWLTNTDECGWYGVTCDNNSKVVELEVVRNNWIGEIPPEMGELKFLQRLILNDNCLYGTLPPELGRLSRLQELDLAVNRLNGYIPDEFYSLSSLIRLDFSSQGQPDAKHVDRSCTLSNGAAGNPNYNDDNLGLEGAILEHIWGNQGLREIVLYDNYFSGYIASEIGNLNQLEILNVGSNAFTGTIPADISKLSNLKELWLELNLFFGSIPYNIGDATALESFSLYLISNMTGTIPDSLYKLTSLKELYLYENSFEGSIKSEIGDLRNLTYFSISNNQFTGTLPSEFGLCEKLEWVQIDHTRIEGTLPSEVCALKLKDLNSEDPQTNEYLKADCLPQNDTGKPFIYCDCCSVCCDHSTNICINLEA